MKVKTTFADRLVAALEFKGVSDHKKQIEMLAKACGVSFRTASSYLKAEHCPMNNYPLRLLNLSKALGVTHDWLYDGSGYSPAQLSVAKSMSTMTDWQKNKMLRMAIRLINGDVKVQKYFALFEGGFISRSQFFNAM